MAYECSKKVRVDDTLEMEYYIDDCTDPWKKPETIVLLHGCWKPRQMLYAWIPTLARHFRVIRPQLRGHWGSTATPVGYQWTIEGIVSDLKNFLDAMDLDKVHFLGETLGGVPAFHLAYRYPERLKTLTLVTVPGPSFKHHRVTRSSFMIGRPVQELEAAARKRDVESYAEHMKSVGPENQALGEWYIAERRKCPLEASKAYIEAAANCEVNVEEFLPRITMPVLMLMGADQTFVITVQEAQRFCSLMPRAKLVTFPGLKWLCQVVIPEKCAQEVVRFIKEQDAK